MDGRDFIWENFYGDKVRPRRCLSFCALSVSLSFIYLRIWTLDKKFKKKIEFHIILFFIRCFLLSVHKFLNFELNQFDNNFESFDNIFQVIVFLLFIFIW